MARSSRGPFRLGLVIAGWTLFCAMTFALFNSLPVIFLIACGVVDLRALGQRLVRPEAEEAGFLVELDEPEYGLITIRNTSGTIARGVSVRVIEDFSWCDAGETEEEFWLGDVSPGGAAPIPYFTVRPQTNVEIGRLSIWIRSDRRTAFWSGEWSYAY